MHRTAHRNSSASFFCPLALCIAMTAALSSCGGSSGVENGGGSNPPPPPPPESSQMLTSQDVDALIQGASTAAQSDTMAIAVVDRLGRILAIYKAPSAPALVTGNFGNMVPPDAALYGIENTNRGCILSSGLSATIPPAGLIDGSRPGLGVATGKADVMDSDPAAVNTGGVPIFKNGIMVGGIGVAGVDPLTAEYAAFTATQINFDGVFDNVAALPPPGEV